MSYVTTPGYNEKEGRPLVCQSNGQNKVRPSSSE
jgi:hypothetical protein